MIVVYSITIFLSAGLLFLVQPLIAKLLLPQLGGSPSVWNTSMVFFQAVLLAGYAYAHGISRWFSVTRACLLHTVVLLVPIISLPIVLPEWQPPTEASPIPWLIGALAVTVGLPFFVLSSTGPIIQRWFAATSHPSASDPYFLYAASNTGSLLALLAYPFLLEPLLPSSVQTIAWSAGYGLFLLGMIVAAVFLFLHRRPPDVRTPSSASTGQTVTTRDRALWVLLAFVPSSLMLGVTNYLSTDIAAVPMLWVIPLAIYLLTFILAFSKRQFVPLRSSSKILPIIAMALVAVFLFDALHRITLLIPLHLIGLFFGAMVCHSRLAALRPEPSYLTEFYLLMSLGGVCGGVFNAIVSPLVFNVVLEYPIAIALACLLRPATIKAVTSNKHLGRLLDLALPVGLLALLLGIQQLLRWCDFKFGDATPLPVHWFNLLHILLSIGLPIFVTFLFVNRPIRFALATSLLLFVATFSHEPFQLIMHRERTFFGVYSVEMIPMPDPDETTKSIATVNLLHGTTLHGFQRYPGADRNQEAPVPVGYHHREGPLGRVFDIFHANPSTDRVAVVGLGAGTVAAYGKPGQTFSFYEIDPAVVRMAKNEEWFTYLKHCRAQLELILGDGRVMLAKAQDHSYGLIILDAFSSDAIPAHLLTKQAIELYLAKLSDDGLIACNITNRHVDLRPILAAAAHDLDLVAIERRDLSPTPEEILRGRQPTHWIVFARNDAALGDMPNTPGWARLLARPGDLAWTDDFSDILSVLVWID